MTRSAVSWDDFDRRQHPPVDGQVLPYTPWGALVAWGLGPRLVVLAPPPPPMTRHERNGRRWVAPTTEEDLAWIDEHLIDGTTRWGLPAPPVRWDFVAVLPETVTLRRVTGAVNGAWDRSM